MREQRRKQLLERVARVFIKMRKIVVILETIYLLPLQFPPNSLSVPPLID